MVIFQLRDKENYIMQKEKNPGDWKDGRRGGVGLEETLQKYKELERFVGGLTCLSFFCKTLRLYFGI